MAEVRNASREALSVLLTPIERALLDGLAEIIAEEILRQRGGNEEWCEAKHLESHSRSRISPRSHGSHAYPGRRRL
jgi:hypothetical protein